MQLFVKTLTGATLTVNVEGSNIVDELKYVFLNYFRILCNI